MDALLDRPLNADLETRFPALVVAEPDPGITPIKRWMAELTRVGGDRSETDTLVPVS